MNHVVDTGIVATCGACVESATGLPMAGLVGGPVLWFILRYVVPELFGLAREYIRSRREQPPAPPKEG